MTRGQARRQRLYARRQELQLRSAGLRDQMAADTQAFRRPMAMVDRAGDAANWLLARPEWPVGALALVVLFRPRALFRWTGRAVWAWQLWRKMRPLTHQFLRSLDAR